MAYDFCLSLGGSCSAAIQLKRRGLRMASLPFDWLLACDRHCFAKALEVVERVRAGDEGGWLMDIERIEPPHAGPGLGPWQYRDRRMGFEFLHDFHCDVASDANRHFLDDVHEVYRRRFVRLVAWLEKAKHVLLVLDCPFDFSVDELRELREGWSRAFPSVDFELVAILWQQANPGEEALDHLRIRRLARPKHRYDNESTTPVWDFLDEVSVTEADSHPQPVRRLPLRYRFLRLMFLASRKLLRQGGWLSSVE